jgi:muramoyltetrapeptide carboxypeptidase
MVNQGEIENKLKNRMDARWVRAPGPLRPGSRIGIVAPSGAVPRDKFEQGMAVLESMGFSPVIDDDVFRRHRYLAGTDHQRAAAIHRCFDDDRIDAVLCARGGYGALRVLPFLNLGVIRRNPKPFIGFSDISALHWVFYKGCGLATYHGPVATSLPDAESATWDAMASALCSQQAIHLKGVHAVRSGRVSGPVVGGNLSTLTHLLGTPYAPRFSGCILLLEDTNEPVYKIDRMLSQMRLSGCSDGLSGLVLGSFTECGSAPSVLEVVTDVFDGWRMPIVAGVDVGHGPVNLTVPLGTTGVLDAAARTLVFHRETIA